jgi:hypothetical protein
MQCGVRGMPSAFLRHSTLSVWGSGGAAQYLPTAWAAHSSVWRPVELTTCGLRLCSWSADMAGVLNVPPCWMGKITLGRLQNSEAPLMCEPSRVCSFRPCHACMVDDSCACIQVPVTNIFRAAVSFGKFSVRNSAQVRTGNEILDYNRGLVVAVLCSRRATWTWLAVHTLKNVFVAWGQAEGLSVGHKVFEMRGCFALVCECDRRIGRCKKSRIRMKVPSTTTLKFPHLFAITYRGKKYSRILFGVRHLSVR